MLLSKSFAYNLLLIVVDIIINPNKINLFVSLIVIKFMCL
jgi:hypothetical protein